jgi:hypothetical protein
MTRFLATRWQLLCSVALCAFGSACAAQRDSQAEAIDMARNQVLMSSQQMKDHVRVDAKALVTKEVQRSEDGGWVVTLAQGECVYMIYANPGHELDVMGVSAGCFAQSATTTDQ